VVDASSLRLVNLAEQWEKHRTGLIDEYRQLKVLNANRVVRQLLNTSSHIILDFKIMAAAVMYRLKDVVKGIVSAISELLVVELECSH